MRIEIEDDIITVHEKEGSRSLSISTPEGFAVLSHLWLRSGWDTKYVYSFTWMGRPIIQLPEDIIRLQEVIYRVKPDVIIETGIAHGGSLVFYASLCRAMAHGRVIGLDIEIRPRNRHAIEMHELSPLITLIEGSSIDPKIVNQIRSHIKPNETVIVLLDSNHTKDHVLAELMAYAPLVTKDSYIVAMDGIMEQVVGAPRTQPDWSWNNPKHATLEFIMHHPDFVIEDPSFSFNEGTINKRVTYWPDGFIKRIR